MNADKDKQPKQPTTAILAYKGFDQNWQCRGFQYEVGKTYTHDGEVSLCNTGFHACEYPLDVFSYYSPGISKFATVDLDGVSDKTDSDTKRVGSSLTIKAELDLAGIINAAIEYTIARAKPTGAASNSGDCGAASNSGDCGAASNSGTRGAASNSGMNGVAANFGYAGRAKSSATGAIVLVHRNDNREITHIRAAKVGEGGIKPDTWYELNANGEFVEVAP